MIVLLMQRIIKLDIEDADTQRERERRQTNCEIDFSYIYTYVYNFYNIKESFIEFIQVISSNK